jgi:hypothetical protein
MHCQQNLNRTVVVGFGVSISEKKPVSTVTVGSVTIPIYAAPVKVTKPVDATDAKNCQRAVKTGHGRANENRPWESE